MFGKFCKVLLAGSTPFVFWDVPFENMYKLGWVGQYLGEMVGGHKLEHGWGSQVGLGWTIFRGNGWSSLISHVRPKCLAGRACRVRVVLPCRVVFVHSANTFWCLVWESNCECGLGSHILRTLLVYISNSRAGLGQVVWLPTPSGVHFTQHLLVVVLGIRSWVWIGFTHALHIAVLGQVVNFGSVISLSSCTFGCSSCLKDWGGRLADCERVFDLLHKTNCRVSKRHDVQGGGGGGYGQSGWPPLLRIGAICADAPVLAVCKVRVVVRTIGFAANFANFVGVLC